MVILFYKNKVRTGKRRTRSKVVVKELERSSKPLPMRLGEMVRTCECEEEINIWAELGKG